MLMRFAALWLRCWRRCAKGKPAWHPSSNNGKAKRSDSRSTVSMKVLTIYSNVDHTLVVDRLESGKVSGCGQFVPPLTAADVNATTQIVAQMGPEPFLDAMMAHPDFDVVIGGRAYDPAPYVAFCAFQSLRRSKLPSITSFSSSTLGGFTHMGKIMECGGTCATPKSSSAAVLVYSDGTFDVRPLSPGSVCTPLTVAAHTLYEKTRPDRLPGPGGVMDLTGAKYEPLSDGVSVRVKGATFESTMNSVGHYAVKLEGAKTEGYRTVFMGSFSDPILIEQLPSFIERVKQYAMAQQPTEGTGAWWNLDFHTYGFNEADPAASSRQVFIVGEALALTQELANSVAATARVACMHGSYERQKATSGNFGMGIGGPPAFEAGASAAFSVYHLMQLEQGEEGASEFGDPTSQRLFHWKTALLGSGPRIERGDDLGLHALTMKETSPSKAAPNACQESPAWEPSAGLTLGAAAKVLRSKNSGPYEITLDVIFDDVAVYKWIKASNLLRAEVIAQLYGLDMEDIAYCDFFDQAMAFKATIPRTRNGRKVAAGGFMEQDVHGSQQYGPLSGLQLNLQVNTASL